MARPKGSTSTPKYRLHKATGQGVVTIDGKDFYLGKHEAAESRQKYERMIGEWYLRGRQGPAAAGGTVAQIAAGYLESLVAVRGKAGIDKRIVTAMKWLCSQYGDTAAHEFSAAKLMAIRLKRAEMNVSRFGESVDRKPCRIYINHIIAYIKGSFRWAAMVAMIPPSVWHSVAAVTPWRRGECPTPDNPRVRPVDAKDIEAILEVANPLLAAMLRVQLYTGMRSGEVCQMRPCDIEMSGDVWKYRPKHHKTERHSIDRVIYIGPQAQDALRPFLRTDVSNPIFRPCDSDRYQTFVFHHAKEGIRIKTIQRSRAVRAKEKQITCGVYCNAVKNAWKRAEKLAHARNPDIPKNIVIIKRWHSHQLRHNAATYLRAKFGIDAAQMVLGHTSRTMTEGYAEIDTTLAAKAMAEVG